MKSAGASAEPVSTRRRIRDAAIRLFGENGFAATSMRDLAGATGLQAASLYGHFASKEDLLLEVLDDLGDVFLAGAKAIVASRASAEGKLRALFVFHFRVVSGNLFAATVHFHEYRHLSAERKRRIVRKRDDYGRAVSAIVAGGIADGSFREVDLSLTTIQILSVLNYTYHWYSPRGPRSSGELAALFAETFLHGLASRAGVPAKKARAKAAAPRAAPSSRLRKGA